MKVRNLAIVLHQFTQVKFVKCFRRNGMHFLAKIHKPNRMKNLEHFLEFWLFTFPGKYLDDLRLLPDDIKELGVLVRKNVIHRTTLEFWNTGTNMDLRFGDMSKIWSFRQADDDYLVTASAMLSELYRLDSRGLTNDRDVTNKIVVTCRFVSILMASILKSKGIPARVRSGFAPYFTEDSFYWDHWVTEYWNGERWVLIDVDGSLSMKNSSIDPFDIPIDTDWSFISAARAWFNIRNGDNPKKYQNAGGFYGPLPVTWELFYDFHSLMRREIIYLQTPRIIPFELWGHWENQTIPEETAKKIDTLAMAMTNADSDWENLQKFWQDKDFRILKGWLL